MFDILDRFEKELKYNKNSEIQNIILQNILEFSSEFLTISTYSEGRMIFVNDGFLKTIGWTKEEFIGKTVDQLNLWTEPRKRVEMLQILKKKGVVENFEATFRHRLGHVFTYLLSSKPVNILGVYCIITKGLDFTMRRKNEEQTYSALKDDLRQTVQSLDNQVCKLSLTKDGDLSFVLSEGKLAETFGCTTEVVFGKKVSEVFPPELYRTFQPHLLNALKGETTRFEFQIGDRVLIKSLSPYYEHDKITGVVGSATDITERKKLEKLLQVSELSSALGELAAGAAHEIRNPLTSVMGFVQLIGEILEKNNIEKGGHYVELMMSELSRINHIVSEMLWLRKPKDTIYEIVNVWTLWQQILPLVFIDTNLKSIQVSLQVNSKPQQIRANLDLLKQVILNVCRNAIEAMDNGGTLHISESYTDDDISILIKDTGPGIPPDVQDKIFTPFFTTKSKGTGLGLFISKQIITDMNGQIEISSDSSGTLVSITFPVCCNN